MKQQFSFRQLQKKLDNVCRKIVLIRDSADDETFKCISCGKVEMLNKSNVSHYISRRYLSTRWDLHNIHLSCVYCNKYLSGNLIEYRKTLVQKYGLQEVERLEMIYKMSTHYSTFDLEMLLQNFEALLKRSK
jgi:hypothetical protein